MYTPQDKGLVEAFQPVLEWDEPSEGAGGWKDWGLRIAFAGGFALLIYALYSHGPDTGNRSCAGCLLNSCQGVL